jgi:multiple sugar transport system ATP-binding protein
MADLKLKNINKVYSNGFHAVKDVSLDIEDKEFLVLVGPSGCGKSTTLRMVAGLEKISSGELYIDDLLVNDVAPKDRDIAMVFQNYALYPHMNVFDNMGFSLKLKKVPKSEIKEKVHNAAKILGIEELLDRKPKQLSGGQKQRVALGRAIVRNPKVFLMDEPLSNLDAKLRIQMRSELIKLHQNLATTFIYVTHDQTEAMTMGTRIVVMKDGIVHQIDTPQNIYKNPANMFVAGFIGSPQMNFIDGTIIEKDNEMYFKFLDNMLQLPEDKASIIQIKELIGKDVVLGIRPEDINHNDEMNIENNVNPVDGIIEVVEMLGAEAFLYLNSNDIKLVVRVENKFDYKFGDKVKLYFNMNKTHIFDKETEKSIF